MTHVNPSLEQNSFRGRNDDGSESAATWKATANTDWTQAVDENFRIRFLVQETAGGSENNVNLQLQYNHNGGGWNSVNASSSVVQSSLSGNFAEDDNTTQQIGSGTFISPNSGMDEDEGLAGESSDIDFAGNDEVEVEYCCQILSGDVADTDTVQLRVVRGDLTVLETYTNTPTVTVSESSSQEFTKTLSATATGSANISRQTAKNLSLSATGVASLIKEIRKTLSPTATGVASLDTGLQFTKTLSSTSTGVASLNQSLVFLQTVSTSATASPTLSTAATFVKTLTVAATGVASIVKSINKTISATASVVADLTKAITKTPLSVTATGSSSLNTTASFLITQSVSALGSASLAAEFSAGGEEEEKKSSPTQAKFIKKGKFSRGTFCTNKHSKGRF